jgi:TonB family protein
MNAYDVTYVDEFARWLVRHAARSAPADLAARLEEEWLADLEARRGPIPRMGFAVGCCWATRVIASELSAAGVPATASVRGNRVLAAYDPYGWSPFSRRTTVCALIVCVHILLIYGLTTGLAHKMVTVISPLMQAEVIQEVRPRADPPAPIGVTLTKLSFPDFLIEPRPLVPEDPDPPGFGTAREPHPSPPESPPSIPRPVNRVGGGPASGFPNTNDYYPPASLRLGETGVTTVQVCVGANGRLTADPTIVQSSGNARIDGGALRLARAGSGHYRPTTEEGQPVSSCYPFRIRFDLRG